MKMEQTIENKRTTENNGSEMQSLQTLEEANNCYAPPCTFDDISIKNAQNVILGQSFTVHGNVSILSGTRNESETLVSMVDYKENDHLKEDEEINYTILNNKLLTNKKGTLQTNSRHCIYISLVTMITITILLIILYFLSINYTGSISERTDNTVFKFANNSDFSRDNYNINSKDLTTLSPDLKKLIKYSCLFNETISEINEGRLFKSIENNSDFCVNNQIIVKRGNPFKVREQKTDIRFVVPASLLFVCTFINNFNCSIEFKKERLNHINKCFHDIYYHFIIGINGQYYNSRSLNCIHDDKFESINGNSTLIIGINYCYTGSVLSNIKANGEFEAIKLLLTMLKSYGTLTTRFKLHFPKYCENSSIINLLKTYCGVSCELVFYTDNRSLEKEFLLDINGTYSKHNKLPIPLYDEIVGSIYDVISYAGASDIYACIKKHFASQMNEKDVIILNNNDIQCRTEVINQYKGKNMYNEILFRHIKQKTYFLDLIYIISEERLSCQDNDLVLLMQELQNTLVSCHIKNKYETRKLYKFFLLIVEANSDILSINVCGNNTYEISTYLPFDLIFDSTIRDLYDTYKNCHVYSSLDIV